MGAWVGMGVGVGGVCSPKVAPLSPFTVREAEQTLVPTGCVPTEVGAGCPPHLVHILPGMPPYRGWCSWSADQIYPGVSP